MSIHFLEGAFVQLLRYHPSDLSRGEFHECAIKALHQLVRAGVHTVADFECAFAEAQREVRAQPRSLFYATTRCFFTTHGPLAETLSLWGRHLHLSDKPPEWLVLEPYFVNGYGDIDPMKPDGGLFATIGPISARSPSSALELASEQIHVLFGMLAFWMNLGKQSFYIGRARRLTDIVPGAEITLYNAAHERIDEQASYYLATPRTLRRFTGRDEERFRRGLAVPSQLAKLDRGRRRYVETFFRLYHDAVTEESTEDQAFKLWKAAEFATFCQGGTTDQIARRLAITWRDRDLVYSVCTAVGHSRNQIAHGEHRGILNDEVLELFRDTLETFVRKAISRIVPNLQAWRATLEIGASRYSRDDIDAALPILQHFQDFLPSERGALPGGD